MKFTATSVKFVYLTIIALVFASSACKTISQVQFQTLEAPEIVLPSDVNNLAFVDRNLSFPADSIAQYYFVTGVSIKDSIDHTQNMSLNCYQGFTENISEFWPQDSIPFVRLPHKMMPDTIRHFTPLSWNVVDSLCKETKSDVLVVLEDIQAFNKQNMEEEMFIGLLPRFNTMVFGEFTTLYIKKFMMIEFWLIVYFWKLQIRMLKSW